ncbi:MAG: globin [Ferruginibacter sp.]|nr:globin [Cytophagales bacterium]
MSFSDAPTPAPTLYAWAGGQAAFERLTAAFYAQVGQDQLLGPVFQRMSPAHAAHVAHFIAEVLGGPPHYTLADGGSHAGMVAHHLGRQLTEPQRRRWVNLLLDCADEVGLPTDPEFRAALVGYLEWGSRLAVLNSQPGVAPLAADEPMPRWGWGETGGPYRPLV